MRVNFGEDRGLFCSGSRKRILLLFYVCEYAGVCVCVCVYIFGYPGEGEIKMLDRLAGHLRHTS